MKAPPMWPMRGPSTRSAKGTHPIYNSTQWKQLRARLQRTHTRCVDCGRSGSRGRIRLYADHVIELRDGGAAFDEANIAMRCASCHQIKTQQAKQRRIDRGMVRAGGGAGAAIGPGRGTAKGFQSGVFFQAQKRARATGMQLALENLRKSATSSTAGAENAQTAENDRK